MAVTLEQTEAIPASYPDAATGLSEKAAALDGAAIWQRIEAWCGVRWTEREVVWIVDGPGSWAFPLSPVSDASVERWNDNGTFEPEAVQNSALGGFRFRFEGSYRVTATVGAGNTAPPAVNEAFRRLAEYLADESGVRVSGSSGTKYDVGSVAVEIQRSPTWLARALHLSGAGDLLRPYRRKGA